MRNTGSIFGALILSSFILNTSCEKISNKAWAYYDETGCYEEWEIEKVNDETEENIIVYLNSNGIEVFEIEINNDADNDGTGACETGRRVEVKIKKKKLGVISGLEFKELDK